jgi:hypothetical protein
MFFSNVSQQQQQQPATTAEERKITKQKERSWILPKTTSIAEGNNS